MLKEILYCANCVNFFIFMCHGFQALASLDCNFEEGLCNWVQDKTDAFDWLRESGDTPSWWTGPSSDHTTGGKFYIYIESNDQKNGDIARLNSPEQKPGLYCLQFWYNMYGRHIGTLNVYIKSDGGNESVIFSRTGNTGTRNWRNIPIGINIPYGFKIVIEGIRGNGNSGDIAIDDISMTKGSCSDCDFDNGFCHWIQVHGDNFDWTLNEGQTPIQYTGPSADHTSGNGRYIYIESIYRENGDVAWLVSTFQDAGKYCFSFWYYMYGEHVNRLTVGQFINGTGQALFTKTGNQGNHWIPGNIILKSTTNFQVVLEGRIRNATYHYERDIAVDDVLMTSCQDCDNPTPNYAVANSTNFEYGSVIEITCNTGYNLTGVAQMVCQANSTWSASRPVCKPYDCGNPTPTYANVNSTNFEYDSVVEITCNTGYNITGESVMVCLANGSWSSSSPTCELFDCGNPTPTYANVNSTNFKYGSVVEITCNTGYNITGESVMVCLANGSWSSSSPTCEPFDCGNRTLLNGQFSAPEGTTFGQTATHVCNIGYFLVGDTTVSCTDSGWKGIAGTCEIEDADNDALIAVYVLVPVTVIIVAVLCTIIFVRRRFPNCKKVSESKYESRKNPVITAANKTYTGLALESQNHINHAYEDGFIQLNDEYATITDEQNVNSDNLYYNIAGATGTSKEHEEHNYDHMKETAAHFVDESYSHVSRNKSDTIFEPSYNTTLHLEAGNAPLRTHTQPDMNSYDLLNINNFNETVKQRNETENAEESDYDHAHAGGIDHPALDEDEYSHLNNTKTKQKCLASLNSGNDHTFKNSNVNENIRRTEKKVEISEAGYELERGFASQYELQDTINDDRHYFVLEAEEVRDENNGSENHDYFVLEKTES